MAKSTGTSSEQALWVGAGASEIIFDPAMFPIEGFSGKTHDAPHARVLFIKGSTLITLLALELVNASEETIRCCKDIISKTTGTEENNIWIHSTHAITTPHAPSTSAGNELFLVAVTRAVSKATQEAFDTCQPACMGVGTGYCDVNSNRDIELNGEWYHGPGGKLPSNKTMTILRFDSPDKKPICFLISYGVKPTCVHNAGQDTNSREISSDVPGLACMMMEEQFKAPCLFCMSAAGDQITREITLYYQLDEANEVAYVERSVSEGLEMMQRLGTEMGLAAIDIANEIACGENAPVIARTSTSYMWPNKAGDGEVEITIDGVQLGDAVALVGLKPELNCVTELALWEASPFKHTLLVSFMNGDQKYMPDEKAYELITWEYRRSGCAAGCAEKFVETSANLLSDMRNGKTFAPPASASHAAGSAAGMNKLISFGGHSWFVLDVQDGKSLVLSEKVLEKRAYHAPGGAITWEHSELRHYLNGDFFEKTFTDDEKAKIVESNVANQSNAKYGVWGGNATSDKLFLLSLKEVETHLFGFAHLLNAKDCETGEVVWWHLRSPGEAANVAASVSAAGVIDYHGVYDGVTDPTGGVRPAMWLRLT